MRFGAWYLGLGIWILKHLGDKRSKVGCQQTQEDTQAGVERKAKEVGEAAAETYGEKHAPFGGFSRHPKMLTTKVP